MVQPPPSLPLAGPSGQQFGSDFSYWPHLPDCLALQLWGHFLQEGRGISHHSSAGAWNRMGVEDLP